ncbi:hypothetical protein DFH07DRAFT_776609 [Mycena maculata]|uniref:Uncharacterized protein n=1 Tax=Mycena maculata TaxID=230809 RepID=A0AAD7N528_9AGAR|nr:hypothetical protein DFH07DRAFT_776609 [Mycena maculata]
MIATASFEYPIDGIPNDPETEKWISRGAGGMRTGKVGNWMEDSAALASDPAKRHRLCQVVVGASSDVPKLSTDAEEIQNQRVGECGSNRLITKGRAAGHCNPLPRTQALAMASRSFKGVPYYLNHSDTIWMVLGVYKCKMHVSRWGGSRQNYLATIVRARRSENLGDPKPTELCASDGRVHDVKAVVRVHRDPSWKPQGHKFFVKVKKFGTLIEAH